MTKRIIAEVRKDKSGQRRVTIPKTDKTLKHGDKVEIKKVNVRYDVE